MSGLKIFRKGANIDKVRQISNELSLLGRDNGVDIMCQTITEGKIFYVYPSEDNETFEFVYILAGEVEHQGSNGEKQILTTNDYFTVKGLERPEFFQVKKDVTYLWIITEPTFNKLSEDYRNLTELIKKVETRDKYTFNHSERVAELSVKVANKLKLDNIVNNLNRAANLHDIGKIYIPVDILNKPGRLTREEFELIKKHPGDGADMVRKTSYSYLADIIEQHHERIDGSGYPFGLKGDEITFEAKIIAVCDTWDAMTDDRAYRKALSHEFAIGELKRLSGIHYDPEIVNALEELLKEEGIIK